MDLGENMDKSECCKILKKIYKAGECEKVGLEMRLRSTVLHKWLDDRISVQSFNKLMGGGYLGVSTGNLVAYSLLVVLGECEGRVYQRSFPSDKIFTINWYGTQRYWYREWEWLLRGALEGGCKELVDCFAGSGFIGLMGAKVGYEKVWMDDLDAGLYNYHLVMQRESEFEKFDRLITATGFPDNEIMGMLDEYLDGEIDKRFQRINWKKAVYLFYQKHYKKAGIGSINVSKKEIGEYRKELERTHELYRKVEVSNWHYKRLLDEVGWNKERLFIFDPPFLGGNHRGYNKCFTLGQHLGMIKEIEKLDREEAKVIVVGFDNEIYNERLKDRLGFRKIEFKRESVNGKKEYVWVNFEVREKVE